MKNKDGKSWIMTKTFYGVVFSILIAIAGISTAIYNVSKTRNLIPESGNGEYTAPSFSTTADHQANVKVTGIPDERETTSEATMNDLNRPYTGYYLLPLNSKISKDFSNGDPVRSETMGDWRTHDGIDIAGNVGDNAIAIQDGTVKDAYPDDIWGEVIVIEHGNGLTAKYCGIKSSVKKGAHVEQGQVIGTVVAIPSEAADGIHVHLETEIEGKNVNPVKALNLFNEKTNTAE
ncbi:MAG: M23 family metallopeptidase [Clostridia bacterium]|nr:M23 family metallopeptidase [Clostridia bacterium]